MIREVTMYQAVCDGCGYEFYETCPTENDAIDVVTRFENWQEIDSKLYCPDCYEYAKRVAEMNRKRFGERPLSRFVIKGYEIEAYSRKDAIAKLKHKGLL